MQTDRLVIEKTYRAYDAHYRCDRLKLLLDMSRPASETVEIDLEGEGGFRGVAPHSCEARFWLPGSFGWTAGIGPQIDE